MSSTIEHTCIHGSRYAHFTLDMLSVLALTQKELGRKSKLLGELAERPNALDL
jgi:hypothetical protein